MNGSWKQQQDAMLQEWSRRQSPGDARFGSLEERIAEGLAT